MRRVYSGDCLVAGYTRGVTPSDDISSQERLDRVRKLRVYTKDTSLAFLHETFKRDIEKPFKQLAKLTPLWQEMVPDALLPFTRLESLSRGTLTVVVEGSARLYELDRLLRSGLQTELIKRYTGPAFRKVKLQLGVVSAPEELKD